MKKKVKKCCFCGADASGSAYAVPEGFPRNKEHELKPLCSECGGVDGPTLDEICDTLDRDLGRTMTTVLMMQFERRKGRR